MSLVHPDEPFYFADICAGPGGFSEYILWKKQWRAKGTFNQFSYFHQPTRLFFKDLVLH